LVSRLHRLFDFFFGAQPVQGSFLVLRVRALVGDGAAIGMAVAGFFRIYTAATATFRPGILVSRGKIQSVFFGS
jgi:hypothetical protein